jgi:tetratricopeptide (TPR) repeat protein
VHDQYREDGHEDVHARAHNRPLTSTPWPAQDTLHLLGVIYYQQGDAQKAIPYIEMALQGNKTYEGFHNSLGECYRTLGRIKDAQKQFQVGGDLLHRGPLEAPVQASTYSAPIYAPMYALSRPLSRHFSK